MADARIEARDLCVFREEKCVLDRASLAVRAGEIAVIEGPSGGGKSTMLRAMAQLVPAERGSLFVDGVAASSLSASEYRRRVAYVPQSPVMFEGTVTANIAAGPQLRGESVDNATITSLLDSVGLSSNFSDRIAKELSGGERQRVAVARALANGPSALLLDEPTAALDPSSAAHILALLRALAERTLALVVVTHDATHAAALSATRYRIESGSLRREGA